MFNIPLYLIHSEKLTWLPAIFPDKPIHSNFRRLWTLSIIYLPLIFPSLVILPWFSRVNQSIDIIPWTSGDQEPYPLFGMVVMYPYIIHSHELQEIVTMGKVKYVGLSEFSPEWTRTLHAIHPVTAVQIEWSLVTRCLSGDAGRFRETKCGLCLYAMEFWCLFFGCVFFLKQSILWIWWLFCGFHWNTFFEQNNMNHMLYNLSMPEDGWSFHHQEHVCFTMNNGCCSMNKYAFAIWKSVLSASCFFFTSTNRILQSNNINFFFTGS